MKKFLIYLTVLFLFSVSFAQSGHKGKVVNTMNVEGYTYMEIESNAEKIWIAAPQLEVKVGDNIEASAGMLMTDFYSKTLKKTFKEIYFVTYVTVVKDKKNEVKKVDQKAVEISLSELFKNKEKYNGKSIRFKGVVTKASLNIMGKNWFHIAGESEKEKGYDVVVSTGDTASQNDKVFVEGILSLDKNIGGGYQFPVFIEDGNITLKK